ncbi:trafficking protein particle complex subunit 13 [Marchantia polymorpha subsp. ruderalis]|uniref:Trafficking protein particle complex subunit 13 n=1 Tax=Marchantia polymorpha TaxID=3197 RepID=A0A2R6W9P0_MARPO|nr:hypothetical protein MARPO_0122s0006 [Marchantia polymorpha]BBN02599.1 hypothetical protein Mp_2g16570 [Marchantia polymorpha subsp. ruderalis]|eukprot:PTQ30569.1 hypothetical protein MARPO_0122s0006 [Marchantia polymorpha]
MSSTQGAHSLAFRVMRLCRPALQVDLGLRVDPVDLICGEDDVQKLVENHGDVEDSKDKTSFYRRAELEDPIDALGLSGILVLPQTFGSIYLGETFCSYISVGNHTNHDVRDVGVKAELQTERQKLILADSTKAPLDYIKAGGRYDFIIEHDIKELGQHTLVCIAVYTDSDGERKYLPQYFKFLATNPLSVRTKVRMVKDTTYLEACIENNTRSHLFLDNVKFDPAPPFVVKILEPDTEAKDDLDGLLSGLFNQVKLVRANGGTRHFLYQLTAPPPDPGVAKIPVTNALGKLELLWRTTLGEPGRLQTQQILGNPVPRKEVSLEIAELPSRIILERPFLVRVTVNNSTDHRVGPLQISMSQEDAQGVKRAIVVNGLWSLIVPQLEPSGSTDFNLSLVATAIGVQRIIGIRVVDVRDGKVFDILSPTEVFVEPE